MIIAVLPVQWNVYIIFPAMLTCHVNRFACEFRMESEIRLSFTSHSNNNKTAYSRWALPSLDGDVLSRNCREADAAHRLQPAHCLLACPLQFLSSDSFGAKCSIIFNLCYARLLPRPINPCQPQGQMEADDCILSINVAEFLSRIRQPLPEVYSEDEMVEEARGSQSDHRVSGFLINIHGMITGRNHTLAINYNSNSYRIHVNVSARVSCLFVRPLLSRVNCQKSSLLLDLHVIIILSLPMENIWSNGLNRSILKF